jgi:subtilase family serine protease
VTNAYPAGAYKYAEPPYAPGDTVTFPNWLARWSGTSFATPLVAGCIAAYIADNGGTAQAALAEVLLQAPKTGPGGKPVLS